jgi:hypothetical protein
MRRAQAKNPFPRKCLVHGTDEALFCFIARSASNKRTVRVADRALSCRRIRLSTGSGFQGEVVRPDNKAATGPAKSRPSNRNDNKERSVGDALRAVYREAVEESVPDELLDLLKKLD